MHQHAYDYLSFGPIGTIFNYILIIHFWINQNYIGINLIHACRLSVDIMFSNLRLISPPGKPSFYDERKNQNFDYYILKSLIEK